MPAIGNDSVMYDSNLILMLYLHGHVLPPARFFLQVLKLVNQGTPDASSNGSSPVNPCWEAQTVLLLWLSMLVLTPFDLRTVDSLASVEAGEERYTPLAANILQLGMSYLDHPGATWGMR